MAYESGKYQKGEDVRVARSASAAVALEFEGFKRIDDLPEGVTETEASTSATPESTPTGEEAPKASTRRRSSKES